MSSRKQFLWFVAACVIVVAQVTPKDVCRACENSCCASRRSGDGPPNAATGVEPTSQCPLCAAATNLRSRGNDGQPCHCQLKARHDQPLAVTRVTLPALDDGGLSSDVPVVSPSVPPALGASREYVSTMLAAPIRPPRILFGVWRN